MRTAAVLLLFQLSFAGCASRAGSAGEEQEGTSEVTVVVNNDLMPSSAVSIWIIPQSSRQILIGSVGPGQRAELEFRPQRSVIGYRLRARASGGKEVISNNFSVYDGARVHWELRTNVAIVVDPSD